MRFAGVPGGMDIPRGYGDDIAPVVDIAFSGAAVTDGGHSTVSQHRDRVTPGCRDYGCASLSFRFHAHRVRVRQQLGLIRRRYIIGWVLEFWNGALASCVTPAALVDPRYRWLVR